MSINLDIELVDCDVEYETDDDIIEITKVTYLKSIYEKGKFKGYEEKDITNIIDDEIKEDLIRRIEEQGRDEPYP